MFRCEFKKCESFFTTKYNLQRHIENIHRRIRNFRCSYCFLNFFNKYNYERHLEISHEDRKNFQCHLCPAEGSASKWFGTKWNLNRHIELYHRDRREKWCKKHESRLMELLKSNKIEYTRELSIPIRGCVEPGEKACENKHYARLDFSIQDPRYPDTVTILSVDEHEHKTYGDASEISRILNVVTALQVRSENDKLWEHRPRKFRWIRYNPDSYRVNGNKRQKTLEEREKHLLRLLNTPPKKDRTLELIYAFYSLENGKTFIEESMPEMLRNCISERIV